MPNCFLHSWGRRKGWGPRINQVLITRPITSPAWQVECKLSFLVNVEAAISRNFFTSGQWKPIQRKSLARMKGAGEVRRDLIPHTMKWRRSRWISPLSPNTLMKMINHCYKTVQVTKFPCHVVLLISRWFEIVQSAVSGHGLDGRVSISGRASVVSSTLRSDRSWAQPGTYVTATTGLYWSLPASAKIHNTWGYPFIPPYVFVTWCLIRHRDDFSLLIHCSLNPFFIKSKWDVATSHILLPIR